MSKDILYGIARVELEPLDPSTQTPPIKGAKKIVVTTAETAELEAVTSEGTEDLKRNDEQILAVVRTPDLLYGYNLTFTDNAFDPEVMSLIEGGIVTKDAEKVTGYDSPMLKDGATNMLPFRMTIFVKNYEGDSVKNYVKLVLNNCTGSAPGMSLGKEFYSPELTIKAREATKAKLPMKQISYVNALPTT